MRLIEKSKIASALNDYYEPIDPEQPMSFNIAQIEKVINQFPTVDVAPVVHGHWESFTISAFIGMDEDGEPKWADRRFFVHKECGRRSAIKEKYCPDCGAKMDL